MPTAPYSNQAAYFNKALCCIVIYLLFICSGCTQYKTIHIPNSQSIYNSDEQVAQQASQITNQASAGAVSVDITPPAGKSMGGYSTMANTGQGFRTRIKARVIYLNDGHGNATALVQTDLTAGSLLLQHKVAAAVRKIPHLTAKDIVITASHSHSAAVNHFNNDFYNKHMSAESGLDLTYLNFLSKQISAGIITAYQQRRAAKIATGKKDIYGYNRNRSLAAYLKNSDLSNEQKSLTTADPNAVFSAVNPSLYMLRIDVLDEEVNQYKPLAAFSSFSVHATAINPGVEVYNADLFAYAQKDLQWHIQSQYQTAWPVVHALTAGTQGDMAPALIDSGDNMFASFPVDWPQARKLGQAIGQEAISLFNQLGQQLTGQITIDTAARELDIQTHNQVDEVTLCQQPAVGSPVVAGAYEHRTPFVSAIPFFKGGNIFARNWFFTAGCQGNKSHLAFKYLQPLIEPVTSFPKFVQFQIIKINDMVVLPLPFEVTTQAGKRITAAVGEQFSPGQVNYAWVASNANGYFGYTTTPEEYSAQHYEGGHTLYGQYSTPYLTKQLVKLAQDMQRGTVAEMQPRWQYELALMPQSAPTFKPASGNRATISSPKPASTDQESYIGYQWLDINDKQISWHNSLVRVEQRHNKQWQTVKHQQHVINDDGYDIEVRYLGASNNGMGRYEVRWYNPIVGKSYRFNIAARGKYQSFNSETFNVKTP